MKRPGIFLRWLIIAIAVVVLVGCANAQELVSHGFAFDFIDDSPDAELIDYRYGTSYYGRSERASLGRVSQGGASSEKYGEAMTCTSNGD